MDALQQHQEDMRALMDGSRGPHYGMESNLVETLRRACEDGHLERVKECVEIAGDDGKLTLINELNRDGETALHSAIQHEKKDCFDFLLDNGGSKTTLNNFGMEAFGHALWAERNKFTFGWNPDEQSLEDLVTKVNGTGFGHSPLRRLFEEERATRTGLACGVISGTDEDVIHLAILLKLDEDIKDEYQLDLDRIYTFVGRSLTRVVSTNERKLLLCQALLLQQTGRIIAHPDTLRNRQDLLSMHTERVVRNNCCLACNQVQKVNHLWQNGPCSHVLWCADCKEWIIRMTEGMGFPHTCVICAASVLLWFILHYLLLMAIGSCLKRSIQLPS